MKLITNDETLRRFIPHIMREVKGEVPIFDKLAPFLELAEQSFCHHFVPAELLDAGSVRDLASQAVAFEAYRLAIPALDLVLTPNGFATVGTQKLVPASKTRTDRLVGGLLADRDKVLAQLLHILPDIEGWCDSSQGRWFAATLFPTFDVCRQSGETEQSWAKYQELRPQIIDLEASLSEEWLSPELMSALRSENLRGDLTQQRSEIVRQVQAQITGYLRGGSFNSRRLADIVNFIRQRETEFPEWHNSETAKLFAPPVFRNEKNAKGYWF